MTTSEGPVLPSVTAGAVATETDSRHVTNVNASVASIRESVSGPHDNLTQFSLPSCVQYKILTTICMRIRRLQ